MMIARPQPVAHPARVAARGTERVLVVSEDPFYIGSVRSVAAPEGGRVIACLGPAASPCILDEKALCPLAETSIVALVDSPPGGTFRGYLKESSAGGYAERLQRSHPHTYVVLVDVAAGSVGPTGEVAVVRDRAESLHLLKWILRSRMPITISKSESLDAAAKLLADEDLARRPMRASARDGPKVTWG